MSRAEITKELTLAAIEKMDFRIKGSRDYSAHNDYVAEEISKVYKTIFDAVDEKLPR